MVVKIIKSDNAPTGKLADAEVHFIDGPLAGMKLLGFAVWEKRGAGGRNVTMPARPYSVNGERRNFSLLRQVENGAADGIKNLVLEAYHAFEKEVR